jgi:molybdate transport system substrate-binding protein
VADLAKHGVSIAIGEPSVPVGAYTREVLDRLSPAERGAVLGNVRSEEPDVSSITGKVTQGAVDAGFVYVTDVVASSGAMRAVRLPPDLEPEVRYGAAVVSGAEHPQEARRFIEGLLRGSGAAALRAAGFRPPPGA